MKNNRKINPLPKITNMDYTSTSCHICIINYCPRFSI